MSIVAFIYICASIAGCCAPTDPRHTICDSCLNVTSHHRRRAVSVDVRYCYIRGRRLSLPQRFTSLALYINAVRIPFLSKCGAGRPDRHFARAARESQKRGKVDTAAASSGQETVSETFPKVFLEQFLMLIPNMLLVSYDYRCI